jgi:UDP-N-acetylglucosamine diphosphorylase/glucosamine-1-phosphate N-acetyltransferase
MSIRKRAERVLGLTCEGHVSRHALVGFDEPGAARAIDLADVGEAGTRILLSSRAIIEHQGLELPPDGGRIFVGGKPAGWVLPDGAPVPSESWLRDPASAPDEGTRLELDGYLLGYPWDLIAANGERIASDVAHLWEDGPTPEGVFRLGDAALSVAEGATIEPGVHLDLKDGPIRLEAGVRVEGPARLTGPLFVGAGSTIFGGTVGTSTIGPTCLVRGEVAHSVLLGFVNKAHDGHLGHAILGRWVNLGAFTTNSDLKNNYRPVHVWTPDGDRDSGLLKVGCFLGDHVKTGIGTMLNTGTVIGAGSNVFGGVMPPTVVPPFSWGSGSDFRDHRLEKFLETAHVAVSRRGQELTPGVVDILRQAWQSTAGRRAE